MKWLLIVCKMELMIVRPRKKPIVVILIPPKTEHTSCAVKTFCMDGTCFDTGL